MYGRGSSSTADGLISAKYDRGALSRQVHQPTSCSMAALYEVSAAVAVLEEKDDPKKFAKSRDDL